MHHHGNSNFAAANVWPLAKTTTGIAKAWRCRKLLLTLAIALFSTPCLAATIDSGDTAWVLASTALVLFMTLPGLSLFYGGLVNSKNVLTILMQCFAIACLASVLWFALGYSLSFTGGNAFIGSLDNLFLLGLGRESTSGTIPESVFVSFQMTFAIITPALIVGAFAERVKFLSVLMFSALWLLLVYVPVAHWIWGGGWLAELGVMDFAGGLVVHLTAGAAALVAAVTIGPRRHFPAATPPHNMTMTMTGAAMLWVGWFGFNGGSALAANGDAGMALLVTHLSSATAALTWMLREWIRFGKPSSLGIVTGMVAGLGAVTPASGFIGPIGGVAIGFIAGLVCFQATILIKQKLKIDDSLDVFPVHGVGGIVGTLLVAVFALEPLGGIGLANSMGVLQQLGVQAIGIAAVAIYTIILSWLILKLVATVTVLRVGDEEETSGLDQEQQNESGYSF